MSLGLFQQRRHLFESARQRRHDCRAEDWVIEYALDTLAGPGQEEYRLITSLPDERAFPAAALAATCHERREIETAPDEVRVHQRAHPRPLRSKHPRKVVQEVHGVLLAHLAIRTVMHQAALQEGSDPDRLGFTGALRVLRRAIPRAQRTPPNRPPFCTGLLTEVAAERLPHRRPRHNPRVVRRKMSNFPLKRPPPAASSPTLPPIAAASIRVLWP